MVYLFYLRVEPRALLKVEPNLRSCLSLLLSFKIKDTLPLHDAVVGGSSDLNSCVSLRFFLSFLAKIDDC